MRSELGIKIIQSDKFSELTRRTDGDAFKPFAITQPRKLFGPTFDSFPGNWGQTPISFIFLTVLSHEKCVKPNKYRCYQL